MTAQVSQEGYDLVQAQLTNYIGILANLTAQAAAIAANIEDMNRYIADGQAILDDLEVV